MKKLLTLLLFFPLFVIAQTCDVDLIGFDPETSQISIAILNGENCGCNEYTTTDGNTCGPDNSSSTVMNNESITHLVIGLHIYEDFTPGPCSQADFHPGWTFAYPPDQSMLPFTGGHVTGDTVNVQLNTFFSWECLIDAELEEGQCWELVVWQINLSQTADIVDFPNQFWTDTCGTCADQTQMYPDIDLSNNSIVWCPDELPPPPLYPGCTDEEADNFDPEATFDDGSCEYPPVLGCNDPTACNYNNQAFENDGSCIYCDTPNGEELCNAYWGEGSNYWEFYSNVFDCDPVIVDMVIDSVYVSAINCNIFNVNPPWCDEGLRFNTDFANKGTVDINSWMFHFEISSGWEYSTLEYGVNSNPPNNNPLPPGANPGDFNVISGDAIWEEGDTLFATVEVIGQIDNNLSNNTAYLILPAYPICIEGCMDPLAENYSDEATCEAECTYAPPPCDTIYIELPPDTIYITEIEYITDTVYVTEIETIIDTVYVELPPDTITITETEYITEYVTDTITITVNDTTFVEIIVDNYIYVYDTLYVDCETGLPCDEEPPGIDGCPDWTTIHIPNTFTPNNDGINDVWSIKYDLDCWENVEFWIFNRWGEEIYHDYGSSFDSYPFWDGSVRGGSHYVSDGVYVYIVQGKRIGSAEVIKRNGTITVFR
jgi:gliding motility-associated-like protein